jgi:hypothetical protein
MHNLPRFCIIAALAAYLAACGTTAQTTASIASIETQVQSDANLACGFIPTIATIAALIPGIGTGVSAATSITNAICSAISSAPKLAGSKLAAASAGTPVTVTTITLPSGAKVPISGTFTR